MNMPSLSDADDIDNVSVNTAFTDNNTLVDHDSILTVVDDDTATLTNEPVVSFKQKLAESVVTKSDFPSIRIKVVGMNVHPKESDNKLVYSTIISIRHTIRRTSEDAINDRYKELWKIEKRYTDFVKLHSNVSDLSREVEILISYSIAHNARTRPTITQRI